MNEKQFYDFHKGSPRSDVTVNEVREKLRDEHLQAVAMLLNPLRPGARIFSATVEWELYEPKTAANSLFQMVHVLWEEMMFGIAVYQKDDRPEINKIAARHNLRLANGIPQLIPVLGSWGLAAKRTPLHVRAKMFPVNNANLFTLEFAASSPTARA